MGSQRVRHDWLNNNKVINIIYYSFTILEFVVIFVSISITVFVPFLSFILGKSMYKFTNLEKKQWVADPLYKV